MTQNELNNKIEELEKQIAELKQVKVEEPKQKRWKPENGEKYFYADYDCVESSLFYDYSELDKWNYLTGNCFETPEEAKEYRTKFEIRAKYRKFIEEHTDCVQMQGTICASSEKIIKDAIDYIGGEEVAKKYLFD